MIIYLATTTDEIQGLALTKAGSKNRLISYYSLLTDSRKISLLEYVEEGYVDSKKVRLRKEQK